jgi:hypothetical protein
MSCPNIPGFFLEGGLESNECIYSVTTLFPNQAPDINDPTIFVCGDIKDYQLNSTSPTPYEITTKWSCNYTPNSNSTLQLSKNNTTNIWIYVFIIILLIIIYLFILYYNN